MSPSSYYRLFECPGCKADNMTKNPPLDEYIVVHCHACGKQYSAIAKSEPPNGHGPQQ